jgi:uncharacterized protein (TIGR00251 family)
MPVTIARLDQAGPMAQPTETGVTVKVRVQPKASRNQVESYQAGTVKVRVTAPPQGGKANAAIVSLLAQTLGVAKSRVRIIRGGASRDKTVSVESLTPEEVQARLRSVASGTNEL